MQILCNFEIRFNQKNNKPLITTHDLKMNSHAKIKRLLDMLLLLSGNRNYTVSELAEKYKISWRTIHRYISSFRDVGFVVERNIC